MNTERLRCDIRAALNYEPGTHHAELLNRAYVALGYLQQWKDEELQVMGPVLDYARSTGKCKLGESLTEWLVADHKRMVAELGDGTTGNKYRAELYDEVWQKARDMGYGNVTMALDDLIKWNALAKASQRVAEIAQASNERMAKLGEQQAQVPDGYVLVPVEPTPAMLDVAVSHALMVSLSGDYNWSAYMRDVWSRILAAAPKAEQPPVQEPVATVTIQHFRQDPSMENLEFQLHAPLPQGTHKLYASPVAQQKVVMPERKYENGEYACGWNDSTPEQEQDQ